MPTTPLRRRGFTLIELLLVVSIIALLVALLLGALRAVRETARRAKCATNVRSLVQAALAHADTSKVGAYIPTQSETEDSLGYLFPQFIQDTEVGVCPSTQNVVRSDVLMSDAASRNKYGRTGIPVDLDRAAPGNAADDSGGHSYSVRGWFVGPFVWPDDQLIDSADASGAGGDGNIQRGIAPGQPGYAASLIGTRNILKTNRISYVKESKNVLLLDNDQDTGSAAPNYKMWPDGGNNHGLDGLNAGFADGHSEWVNTPQLIEVYMGSYMAPPPNASTLDPRFSTGTTNKTRGGTTRSYTKYFMAP